MKFLSLVCIALLPALVRAADTDTASIRVRFGMHDTESTDWSGSVTLSPGDVTEIRGWRFALGDKAQGNTWDVHTRVPVAQNEAQRKLIAAGKKLPVADNGVVITFQGVTDASQVSLDTNQGKVSFKLADVPYGKRLFELNGNIEIERAPAVNILAGTEADEDYPAAVTAPDGTTYVAYIAFTHGKDFPAHRERVSTAESSAAGGPLAVGAVRHIGKPEDLDYLAEPAGGEQLLLRSCKNGKWSAAVPVTDGKDELYRPALAIDGSGKVWVFYSAHLNADAHLDGGNWELMARPLTPDGQFGQIINVSNAPGTDMMPAATTDSAGVVWVAWMQAGEAHFNVVVSHQAGAGFTAPARVSDFNANEWDPAIAADKKGHVAITWDTYRKGDYDVYVAVRDESEKLGAPEPVAATLLGEAKSSAVYDAQGQLWIAYEVNPELWGKDFGALKQMGNPLYKNGRSIAVKVRSAAGQWFKPADPMESVPTVGKANGKIRKAARMHIDPCYPRLVADDQGGIWMSFRGRPPGGAWTVAVGSVWFEYLTHLEGGEWTSAVWVPRSNNVLDNRPAMVPAADHTVLMAFSGDSRADISPARAAEANAGDSVSDTLVENTPAQDAALSLIIDQVCAPAPGRPGGKRARDNAIAGNDPNDDIYIARFGGGTSESPHLDPIPAEIPATPQPVIAEEEAAKKAIRDYRVELNGVKYQIWRGEFHRHTEFSPDGGGDGGLLDLWRYTLDMMSLDWIGDGDHNYGNGREYTWWTTQKTVTLFTLPGRMTPMFCYERSVSYPEGHRNCMFAQRGVRSLPTLPLSSPDIFAPAPDTNLLYMYLHHFDAVCAPHTSATGMGTDWRNNDPLVEPFVEIYQGDRNSYERPDAPRTAPRVAKLTGSAPDQTSIGGWRPKGFVNLALLKGYRLAFESSSDHISTHLSFCDVLVPEPSRANILAGCKARRVYGATANIIADVHCPAGGMDHWSGEEFTSDKAPTLHVHLIGAKKLKEVVIIKDDVEVYHSDPDKQDVNFEWTDPKPDAGKTSYYYVRGVQEPDMEGVEGEIVWASPMWIKYQP